MRFERDYIDFPGIGRDDGVDRSSVGWVGGDHGGIVRETGLQT